MKSSQALITALSMGLFVTVPAVLAAAAKPDVELLRGAAQVQESDGSWKDSSSLTVGKWVRASGSDATVRLPGVTMRLQKGAAVRINGVKGQAAQLDAKGGRVFVRVSPQASCVVAMNHKRIEAGESEFVLDAGSEESLYLLGGGAALVGEKRLPKSLSSWSKSTPPTVALDGPDVRKRNNNRRRFTQGEENKGKRIGEDLPPTKSPTPAMTETPAYTPSPTPTATAQPPSPSPSPSPPQPQVTEGGSVWDWLAPVLGAGGAAAIIVTLTNNNNDDTPQTFNVVRPASP